MVAWQDPTTGNAWIGRPGAGEDTAGPSDDARRILLVEDDVRFAHSLHRLLSGSGYEVSMAHTGGTALGLLSDGSFHVAVVDMNLPDMSGHALIRAMHDRQLDTAAIVLSGDTHIDAAIQALRVGALDFVRKPAEPGLLLHSVRRAIRQRCLEREHREIQRRLHRSERLHRYLVDKSPDIIFMLDREARVFFVNSRLTDLLGLEPEAILGRHISQLVYEPDRERARYIFNASKLTDASRHTLEVRLRSVSAPKGYLHFELVLCAATPDEDDHDGPIDEEHYYLVARDITARQDAEERARFHANHDALTGLPNRNLFRDRLTLALVQARRSRERLAVLFLNVDRFKSVNDLYGHARADELLSLISTRIQRCLRGGDTLARFGGDEFLLLNTGVLDSEEVLAVVGRINAELAEPFSIGDKQVYLSVSAGIALYPEHGEDAEALVRHAKVALYHGRITGSSSQTFFMPEMGASRDHRVNLEHDLRQALEADEFELYYQPQMGLRDRHFRGVEALIRWNHPRLGLLPPAEFLPLAEETGHIAEVGDWVIRTALKTLHRWEGRGIAPARMAINISPRHLEQADFVERFMRWVREYQVSPGRLEIELTENLFIRDPGAMVQKLQDLAAQGVRIAIDDFGTQYSSLSYLQTFPIHTLKIDKSFVWEIDRENRQHAIIMAIISIAHSLGLNLVAEGVETEAQLKFLHTHACDEIQGYLVSRPLSETDLEQILKNQRQPMPLTP